LFQWTRPEAFWINIIYTTKEMNNGMTQVHALIQYCFNKKIDNNPSFRNNTIALEAVKHDTDSHLVTRSTINEIGDWMINTSTVS